MIRVHELTKYYGSTLALDRLSLQVPVGSILGLVGPNGAGKTTFLRLVMGFVVPDGGQIDRRGLVPARIGYLPERAFYPTRSKVHAYLTTLGELAGLRGTALRTAVGELLGQLGLEEIADRRLNACSRGMLQRLGLAQALLGDPPLFLFDEPVLGLDPAGQKFMRDQILALRKAGKTVLLSSHNLGEVRRICTHVAVLNRGRLARSGLLATMLPTRAHVSIGTGPMPDHLPSQLAAISSGITVFDGRVTLDGEAAAAKAQVLLMLLQAGVDVRELSEQRATLEEVFLEATTG
jgi:ABC-2 type transport system ATP-binding protein